MKSNGLRFLSFYAQPYGGVSRKNCGGEHHRGVSADTPRTYKLYVGPISSSRARGPLPRIHVHVNCTWPHAINFSGKARSRFAGQLPYSVNVPFCIHILPSAATYCQIFVIGYIRWRGTPELWNQLTIKSTQARIRFSGSLSVSFILCLWTTSGKQEVRLYWTQGAGKDLHWTNSVRQSSVNSLPGLMHQRKQ